MKLFRISRDQAFTEFHRVPFEVEHEESTLEEWLESNPGGILEEGGLLVLGRQVVTNLGGYIDLLGVDREGNAVVIELKRDRTPRDVIAQALEYASYVETLDFEDLEGLLRSHENDETLALAKCHRECFGLDAAEAVAFTFFQDDDGNRLLSQEVVVASTPQKPKPATRSPVDEGEFFASLDSHGRAVLSRCSGVGEGERAVAPLVSRRVFAGSRRWRHPARRLRGTLTQVHLQADPLDDVARPARPRAYNGAGTSNQRTAGARQCCRAHRTRQIPQVSTHTPVYGAGNRCPRGVLRINGERAPGVRGPDQLLKLTKSSRAIPTARPRTARSPPGRPTRS